MRQQQVLLDVLRVFLDACFEQFGCLIVIAEAKLQNRQLLFDKTGVRSQMSAFS